MKYTPTFESFVNEASVKMKDPKKVKVGETAIDGNGKKGKIIAIGTIGEDWKDMKQYATDSDVPKLIRNAAKYGAEKLGAGITIVALQYRGGTTDVWTYDSDNAYVNENLNEASAEIESAFKAVLPPNAKITGKGDDLAIRVVLARVGGCDVNLKWSHNGGDKYRWVVKVNSRTNWANFTIYGNDLTAVADDLKKNLELFSRI